MRGGCIDTVRHEVLVDGEPVALTPSEYQLLLALGGLNRAACTRALS